MTSLDEIVAWLEPWGARELSKEYKGYEDGVRDGKTMMARGVLAALDELKLTASIDLVKK